MAVDALGRIIVGGAQFASDGTRIMPFLEHAQHITPMAERALAALQSFPGHVVVGNGHLTPEMRTLVQTATVLAQNNAWAIDTSRPARLIDTNVPHASTLVRRASNPCLMEINHNDREREMRERNDADIRRLGRVAIDAGLMVGCAAAGDAQGAMENGINAGLGLAEPYIEASRTFWESVKSLFGGGD